MAGINSERIANSLGIRSRIIKDKTGDWVAMNVDDWLGAVEEDQRRRSWSLENISGEIDEVVLMESSNSESADDSSPEESSELKSNKIQSFQQVLVKKVG